MPGSRRARRRHAGTAEDRDGGSWEMRDDGDGMTVRRDGVVRAAVRGGELQVGEDRYALELYDHGPRSATVTGPDGAALLRAVAQSGRRRPWADLRPGSGAPLPLPGILAVAYTLLSDEADAEGGALGDLLWGLIRPWDWAT